MTSGLLHVLEVPTELDDAHRAAIAQHASRLDAARERNDLSDVVGCAKELAECIARIVLAVRGSTVASNPDFGSLITEAHRAVERQPGQGLAHSDATVRAVAQHAKGFVKDLGTLRNQVGTGHGRSVLPAVVEEHALIAVDAALVWTRWVLRRLPAYLLSDPQQLVSLLSSGIFYKGDLAARLDAIDLAQDPDAARAIGVAVGRRAVGETFNVRIEGIDRVLVSPGAYPAEYRSGLVCGLLFDEQGAMSTTPTALALAIDLLLVDERGESLLSDLSAIIASARWTPTDRLPTPPTLDAVVLAARSMTTRLPVEWRSSWLDAWGDRPVGVTADVDRHSPTDLDGGEHG